MDTTHNNLKFELFEATKNGYRRKFAKLAELKPKTILLFRTSHRQETLLHIAAVFGHHELTKDIINGFPNLVKCKNFIGDTPLHVAARAGKPLVVESLIQKADLLAVNDDGNTPLHEAVIHNRKGVVELLLRQRQDLRDVVSKVNEKGKSPLYLAVESRNARIVGNILNLFAAGTSQNGTGDHVNANESVLSDAILENIMGTPSFNNFVGLNCMIKFGTKLWLTTIWDSKRIADPSCSIATANTSQTKVDDVETKNCILHVAVTGKDIGILRMVAERVVQKLPDTNNNLLHLAASLGFLDGVNYLLDRKFGMDVLRHDEEGFCPIHLASKNGHLHVTKVLLDHYPGAREFLSKQHQNILHVAAEYGNDNIVKYILKNKWAEFLINEKDKDGYTPLHLATKNWHLRVVSALTWDRRIDLKQVNGEGLTALEVAEKYMEIMTPFKMRLTWIALRSAGTPRTHIKDRETVKRLEAAKYEPYNMDYCKSRVNTLLLVSTLVATVTFAAGFTMPGGNNSSCMVSNSMLHNIRFQLLQIFDSLAMYSSVIVTVILMWAQLGDLNLMLNALRNAQRLLGFSLAMMSLAFLAGVDLVVTESRWLSIAILAMGFLSLIVLLAFFVPLFLPYTSKTKIFRYISYYPFKAMMLISLSR
ncbi:protein ACCELERATED CELL DEATH 6-like [Bidens hawaiensis]|uniref:protein ACCELERATED CELL DEATH 6-like n=1 Tax=Bidens hawaiensis TaxID=980011 RepID=UPI004048FE00